MATATNSKSVAGATHGPDQPNEVTVVKLTMPMTLQPGAELLVTCSSPISVLLPSGEGHELEAYKPTKIRAMKHILRLSPTSRLGSSFVRGWNKLPEELKLMVLEHELVHKSGEIQIRRSHLSFDIDFVDTANDYFVNVINFSMKANLYRYLSMTPEIARLARDVFYTRNYFMIFCSRPAAPIHGLDLPPNSRLLIRKLVLKVDFEEKGLQKLEDLAAVRFPSLQNLEIRLSWSARRISNRHASFLRSLPRSTSIPIVCSGQGRVSHEIKTGDITLLQERGLDVEELKRHAETLFVFSKPSKETEVRQEEEEAQD